MDFSSLFSHCDTFPVFRAVYEEFSSAVLRTLSDKSASVRMNLSVGRGVSGRVGIYNCQ